MLRATPGVRLMRPVVPNPAEMKVIERMRAMRKDGATYRAIGAVTGQVRAQGSQSSL